MELQDTVATAIDTAEPPPSPAPAELPPTSNLVLQAARQVDITDRAAVVAETARSQTASAFLVQSRQEHEIKIARCNDELTRIREDMRGLNDRAEAQIAIIKAQLSEDLQLQLQKGARVEIARNAAQAAIDVIDRGT